MHIDGSAPWRHDGYRDGRDAALARRPAADLIAVPAYVPREFVNAWAASWVRGYNPLKCPTCLRLITASLYGVIGYHEWNGKKCLGTGCYGGDAPVMHITWTQPSNDD